MAISRTLETGETDPQWVLAGEDYFNIFAAAIDAVATPFYVVTADGRLIFSNTSGRSCLLGARWLQLQGGRIAEFAGISADIPLWMAFGRLEAAGSSTVVLNDAKNGHQAIIRLVAVARSLSSLTSPISIGLMWLTTTAPDTGSANHLARIFKLTRAENRLLTELSAGATLREAARNLGVSIHTVRHQLKSILSKTGRHSQVELMTLVTRMASLRTPDEAVADLGHFLEAG